MKKLTKVNTNYANSLKINEALGFFRNQLMLNNGDTNYDDRRWHFTLYTDKYGRFGCIDTQDNDANYGVELYEHNGDIFFVPGFADETWMGTSLKGQSYEVNEMTGKPVIVEW